MFDKSTGQNPESCQLFCYGTKVPKLILSVEADGDECGEMDQILFSLSNANTVKKLILELGYEYWLPLIFSSRCIT